MASKSSILSLPHRNMTKAEFAKILSDTGLPLDWRHKIHLRRKLKMNAMGYTWFKELEASPPPSEQLKALQKIKDTAGEVLIACGYDGTNGPIEPHLGRLANHLLGKPNPLHKMPRYIEASLASILHEQAKQLGGFLDMPPPQMTVGLLGEGMDYHATEKLIKLLESVLQLRDAADAASIEKQSMVGGKHPHEGDQAISFAVFTLSKTFAEIYGREPAVSRKGPFARFLSACLLAFGEHPAKTNPGSLSQRWSRIRDKIHADL